MIGSAVLPDQDFAHAIFDFPMLAPMPNDPAVPHDHGTCASLRAYLTGKPAEEIGIIPYTRYWNGPMAFTRLALGVAPVLVAYSAFALITLAGFILWGLALYCNGVPKKIAILTTFACLWGGSFPYFAGNLPHSPAFLCR